MLTLSPFLIFTAVNKSCIFYEWIGLNKDLRLKNLYSAYLPLYNPLPIFVFALDGHMVYQNDAAKTLLPEVQKINDLKNNTHYSSGGRTYLIDSKYIYDIDYIFIYTSDVTELVNLNYEIEQTQIEIINMMGMIGETRSKETGNHVKRVAAYSKLLALKYGLDKDRAELLSVASPMHDIGKIGIPDEILNKPGKLTSKEFEVMKRHAVMGYDMLKGSQRPILKAAAIVAYEHHEKYDGSGYPRGLSGENIHIYGRITAVADVFDALGSERVYKKSWPLEKILHLFKQERGRHFDPKLVDILLDNLDEFLFIRDQYQDVVPSNSLHEIVKEKEVA